MTSINPTEGGRIKVIIVDADYICINGITMTPIYVLELENNKYYVGISKQPKHRIKQHLDGFGSKWTKLHKPTGRYRIIREGDNPYNLKVVTETTVTYYLMLKFGYQNVRGAGWSQCHNYKCCPACPTDYEPLPPQ